MGERSHSKAPLITAIGLAVVGGGVLLGGQMMTKNLGAQAGKAKNDLATLRAKNLVTAVELYRVKNGRAPDTLEQLTQAGVVAKLDLDPWGQSYVLVKQGDGLAVVSPGPDQKLGTADDIEVQ